MFKPLEDEAIKVWFRRLDAALGRMPAEEKTRQRDEVRQHLEALATSNTAQGQPLDAAWNAALVQFGDPTQIGRKLYREWKQSRTGFRAAIGFGLSLQLALKLLGASLIISGMPLIVYFVVYLACTPLAGVFIGRKYPMQAIRATFYTSVLCNLWLGITYHHSPIFLVKVSVIIGFQVLVAYFASVTRRGWYKPALADFKLTLPRRRQAG